MWRRHFQLTEVRHGPEITVRSNQEIHQVHKVDYSNGEEKYFQTLQGKHVVR